MAILQRQVYLLVPTLIVKKVYVFKSCRGFCISCVDVSGDTRAFEIIDPVDVLLSSKLKCVSHQNQVYWLVIEHRNAVDTIDSCKHRLWVLLEMLVNARQYLLNQPQLLISHGLDDEALIVTKEEEGA